MPGHRAVETMLVVFNEQTVDACFARAKNYFEQRVDHPGDALLRDGIHRCERDLGRLPTTKEVMAACCLTKEQKHRTVELLSAIREYRAVDYDDFEHVGGYREGARPKAASRSRPDRLARLYERIRGLFS
jgi:hypothetical protein